MNKIPSFDDFPENLQLKILGELDVITRLDFKRTAKRYNKLINENDFVVNKMVVEIKSDNEQRGSVFMRINQNDFSWSIKYLPPTQEIRILVRKFGFHLFTRSKVFESLEKAEKIWCDFFCIITKGMIIRELRFNVETKLFSLPRQITQVKVHKFTMVAKPSRIVMEPTCLRWLSQFVPNFEFLKITYGTNRDSYVDSSDPTDVRRTSFFRVDPLPILRNLPISDEDFTNIRPSDLDTFEVDDSVLNGLLNQYF